MRFYEIFEEEDGQLSWFRVASTITLLVVLFTFVWSVLTKYADGLFWSGSITISLLGLKVGQKHIEKRGKS